MIPKLSSFFPPDRVNSPATHQFFWMPNLSVQDYCRFITSCNLNFRFNNDSLRYSYLSTLQTLQYLFNFAIHQWIILKLTLSFITSGYRLSPSHEKLNLKKFLKVLKKVYVNQE